LFARLCKEIVNNFAKKKVIKIKKKQLRRCKRQLKRKLFLSLNVKLINYVSSAILFNYYCLTFIRTIIYDKRQTLQFKNLTLIQYYFKIIINRKLKI